jgi:hypothetical protein
MKKILLLLSLSLLLLLPGCGSGGSSTCTRSNLTPGATYRVYYAHPEYPPERIVTVTASSTGSATVSSYGFPCDGLIWVLVTNSNVALSASPASVYLPSPPTTTTISGQGFDTTYAMPEVEYFDSNGYLVGSVYASSVSGDGTSLQANVPDLSNVYSGTYQVRVTNKTSGGYYTNIVGSATMTGWGRDRVDSDGDGWYDDEDCAPYDPSLNYSCADTCGGTGTTPYTLCEPMY